MLLTLLFVVFVYLFAVESFTAFLYPSPEEVASISRRRLPSRLFDMMIGAATLTTIIGWIYVYVSSRPIAADSGLGRRDPHPAVCPLLEPALRRRSLHRLEQAPWPPSDASMRRRRDGRHDGTLDDGPGPY